MEPQGGAYVEGFAIQVGSIWVAIPILVAVVFGVWNAAVPTLSPRAGSS